MLTLPRSLGGPPRALVFRPRALWIGEAGRAREMLAGRFRFAGREAEGSVEGGPWRLVPPSEGFAEALHGFDWLDDLAAADTAAAREQARRWAFGWMARQAEGRTGQAALAWRPDVAGRRVLAWLHRADLLTRQDPALERQLAAAVDQHARRLRREAAKAAPGRARLEAEAGLFAAVLALEPGEGRRGRALARLSAAAAAQIGEDGGVANRSPEDLCEALILLENAAAMAVETRIEPGSALTGALDRAQGALRALRMRDGALPRFHGGGPGRPGRLDHALGLVRRSRTDAGREGAMGFVKLTAGRMAAVVDAAAPPATETAHASTLAFELAAGARRLVVNSGPGAAFGGDWAAACRATAAQSTLSLAGVSSSRVGAGGGRFRSGPKTVTAETVQDLDGAWFMGEHDGYLESHGLVHRRRLFLSPDGRDFRGEDALVSPAGPAQEGLAFVVRFHLHPDAAEGAEGLADGARLTLPDGVWRFTMRGGEATLEDSVFFDEAAEAPRATRQIVVSGRVAQGGGRVVWSIARES